MSQCPTLPTINDLAQDYKLPAIADLFLAKATDIKIAEIKGLSVPELGLKDADVDLVFSYQDEFPRHKGCCPTVELTLKSADDGNVVACASIGEDDSLKGRFNRYTGIMPVHIDHLQFAIDNPPYKLIKNILCGRSKAFVNLLV